MVSGFPSQKRQRCGLVTGRPSKSVGAGDFSLNRSMIVLTASTRLSKFFLFPLNMEKNVSGSICS